MNKGFDKGVDELFGYFVRREKLGGKLVPVGAELGGGDESTVRNRWGVPVRIKERMIKLKRRKHMNNVEVLSREVPVNV